MIIFWVQQSFREFKKRKIWRSPYPAISCGTLILTRLLPKQTNCLADVKNFVKFLSHSRTRLSQKTTLLKVPLCRTTTFQSSYFNRIVKLWNCACNVANISTFSSADNFQIILKDNYFNLLNSIFDTDLICTWSSVRDCPCHKS